MSPLIASLRLVVIVATFLVHSSGQETSLVQDNIRLVEVRGPIQPPLGKCSHITLGGTSGVHFYVCCNNCNENNGKPVCDNTTYQGATDGQYCGHCGIDKGNGWLKVKYFKCGGCTGQDQVQATCTKRYGWIFPSLCWIYSSCIQHRCRQRYDREDGQYASAIDADDEPFCGDDNCGPGENSTTCPFDCCPVSNPAECRRTEGSCPPVCCSYPTCCGTSGTPNIKGRNVMVVILTSIMALNVFISLHDK